MADFEPKSDVPDNSTDRGKIERIKASGTGDNTETTEWVTICIVSTSTPANPGFPWLWWHPTNHVLSMWDVAEAAWISVTGVFPNFSWGTTAPASPAVGDFWLDTN